MPEAGGGPSGWDFLTIITAWSLYGLPLCLLCAGVFVFVRNRRLPGTGPAAIAADGRRAVCIVALIHLALGLHGAILLTQELLTLRVMGVPQSFANLIVQTLSVIENPLLALWLWRARRWARYFAIAWYLLLAVIGAIVAHWLWRYRVPVKPRSWPNQVAGVVMPIFLLAMMFVPRVRRVFVRPKMSVEADVGVDESQGNYGAPTRWSFLSLICLLFLIVVVSNLAVDTADWIERSVSEWNQTEPY